MSGPCEESELKCLALVSASFWTNMLQRVEKDLWPKTHARKCILEQKGAIFAMQALELNERDSETK